ncbi:maleate isomerase [Streptomyces sp. SLBN-31]|nr:maleate isomerase [Streptomyces sp. SLBN-31]
MDVSFLGGPRPQRGVGVVAPFDFALDRELWRWVPDDVSLHLTRTPYVPVEVSLDLARLVSEHETLDDAVRTLTAISPEVVAYACTSGSFVGGIAGERAMCVAMTRAGAVPSVTTSGALLEALAALGAHRVALVTPYTVSVTRALEEYVAEAGVTVAGCAFMGLTRHIWTVPYREVVAMARRAVRGGGRRGRAVHQLHQPADLRRHPPTGGRTAHAGDLGQPGHDVGGARPNGYSGHGALSGADRSGGAVGSRTAGTSGR